jgi:hypothetical protein
MIRATALQRAALTVACLALASGACRLAGQPPAALQSSSASSPTPAASAGAPSLQPTPPGPLSTPDRPYDVDAILQAMADSRRPDGVPDELQNRQVAASVAHAAWTWDGAPWEALAVSGSCGPELCSLELVGTNGDGAGVELVAADLHAYPRDLEADLDAAARAALDPERLEGLALVSARWLPPPDRDRYLLAYRSGGEEGAPRLDILLDLATGEVIDVMEGG